MRLQVYTAVDFALLDADMMLPYMMLRHDARYDYFDTLLATDTLI